MPRSAVSHLESGELADRYREVRRQSLNLCSPMETEDCQVQPMDDASPPKWHLAHVTWFFETFLLKPLARDYTVFEDAFEKLFNSYYNGVGTPFARARRGLLSRPTLDEVIAYRRHVDEAMLALMREAPDDDAVFRIELGLHHEQQHQELILTDLKYNLGNNPLKPVYIEKAAGRCRRAKAAWVEFEGGLVETGSDPDGDFVFDNETPRHSSYLRPFALASHLATNGDYIEFIEDDGYRRPELWLSDGWTHLQSLHEDRWEMPLYWRKLGDDYLEYRLTGEARVDPNQPVCHVSGYEADAFARWKRARLPTETEWEHAGGALARAGNFVETGRYHPWDQSGDGLSSMFGNVWEWTASSYAPYPGYRPFAGQLGEYNGKFMANQLVLKGGSCATPRSHIRASYRNFFYPPDRWQFTGIRLARDPD